MEILKVIFTSLLSVSALFILTKLMGNRQMSQLSMFDYINGITIGSIAAELATDLENMWKPLLALALYALITWVMSLVNLRFGRSRRFLNGTPTIVMDGGRLYRDNMKKAKLDLSEFMSMCRAQGYFDLSDIQTAVFEYNGRLSILPVEQRRPVTPEDMGLAPAQRTLACEVIMDGRVLEENLRRMGVDAAWLQKQLKAQGICNAHKVYLGICDAQRNLMLYQTEPEGGKR